MAYFLARMIDNCLIRFTCAHISVLDNVDSSNVLKQTIIVTSSYKYLPNIISPFQLSKTSGVSQMTIQGSDACTCTVAVASRSRRRCPGGSQKCNTSLNPLLYLGTSYRPLPSLVPNP